MACRNLCGSERRRPSRRLPTSNSKVPVLLTDSQREDFDESGYLILEGILDPEECQLLRDETDVLISDRIQKRRRMVVSYHEMAMLTSHPKIVGVLLDLMGRRFAMHHIHCARHDEGTPGVGWHQDYEQIPQTNRSHLMVHVFYYLNGLNGTIGDLMVVPKSHRSVVERNALALFGTNDLPGSMTIGRLPPGTAVIVHSALWHARRAREGGSDSPRYFIDVSYCQNGILWPSYPYMHQINEVAIEAGAGRNGQYDWIFESQHFFDKQAAGQRLSRAAGSILEDGTVA